MDKQNSLELFSEQGKFVRGKHLVTIFHNEQNLYTVLRIRIEETNEEYEDKEAVITGYFPRIHEQESYVFFGEFKDHPKFGLQYQVSHFRKDLPQSKQGVINYLSGELFKGIGKKTAEKIVDTLGENAISRILSQPSILDTIPKLPPDKAKQLYDTLMEHQGLEQIMVALNEYGFGPQLSMKIYQAYKENTIEILQSNPYKLVEDVEGIGFGRADELGYQLGIRGSHPDRIKAACLYCLELESMQAGHVFANAADVLESVKKLLEDNQHEEIEFQHISNELVKLEQEGKLVVEEKRLYLPSLFFSEKGVVTNIKRLLSQTEYKDQFPESEFLLALGSLEERLGVQYAPSQKEAIQTALMSPMLILTGGPGTGKTTVIKGIVELYAELHGCSLDPKDYKKEEPFPFLLAAPTGRAAKRMTESTGLPAVTIHRLLGWNGTEGFDHHEDNPLEGKILIVDETSMVDIWLANQLFKALPANIQVILVGDEDQLPSVGPGQVLKDLLQSECVPTVLLSDIYRQAEGSSIIELAHSIKNGQLPQNISVQQPDRSFIKCSPAQVADVIEKVAFNAKKKGYSAKDIQVLAPMYRGPAGIDRLNVMLQEIFNPNPDGTRKEISFGDVKYRIGDKVLQLVNQPESHVYNGDIGEIVSIFYARENTEKQDMVIVSFDGVEATYTRQDLNQITHAYCCSVHKSQGSEFPIVILPVVKSYYRMLRRNLIYTGITRSKQFLILCGEPDALRIGVERADDQARNTTLSAKLRASIRGGYEQEVAPSSEKEISYEEQLMNADPMIGMENTTPYDFLENLQ
ncbi:ATP-dependent RecD-like DNA helicase [Bacillus canaveralius]|uniref:ATP-dependent RecD2 DNA helicase n=1 Tax=Bacillus canaveralius TaxID=1403243 RepID=A0A2N5GGR3_9BACI|nr:MULTISPECIES: ATP-dependent RecD-like DNA helicase [Bacillus]PLR79948.1 ATP-dependent RecD-like DNA helicase [Bacillus canaveralius]PLR81881.1 ATP-dependent RecD-like DNA helicase [Bacillus sp. V33-4]PLR99958.1 ATP-dependent RecD-like DNA helicase [Bacillus canaveralius]RSK47259.1 ATP-dependent RecD-like DNA helicase [Bacillus canaveralius]